MKNHEHKLTMEKKEPRTKKMSSSLQSTSLWKVLLLQRNVCVFALNCKHWKVFKERLIIKVQRKDWDAAVVSLFFHVYSSLLLSGTFTNHIKNSYEYCVTKECRLGRYWFYFHRNCVESFSSLDLIFLFRECSCCSCEFIWPESNITFILSYVCTFWLSGLSGVIFYIGLKIRI